MIFWIRSGSLVDPVRCVVEKADLVIEGDRIVEILPPDTFEGAGGEVRIIDATGKLVLPGFIDMHVHLREPGHEYKETIKTGSMAAVAGGFTALACMPNTVPPNDSRSVTEFIIKQARRAGLARIYPVAAITVGQKGECLTEFGDLKDAGAVAVSDDGLPVTKSEVMRRAMEYARYHGLLVISHPEDVSLSAGGVMHEGLVATQMGLQGIPSVAEDIMVFREISLARLNGCPVHIAHVSTAGSVELVRRAKEDGLPVTAETAPHYFSLDHSSVVGYNTNAKVNPPLRSPKDVEAVKKGLTDGVIDVIATDHAPHSSLEKDVEFDKAAFGMIGLETALPLTLELVRAGILDLPGAIAKLTCNAASILGISGGLLEKDGQADITLIDPDFEFEFKEENIFSRSKNSPFIGKRLKGITEMTMIGGKIVFERDVQNPGRR